MPSAPAARARAPEPLAGVPPEPTAHFAGREADLAELRRQFQQSRRVALHGLGGVGKTQLAIRYLDRHSRDYPDGCFWLRADQVATLVGDLASLAWHLGLPERELPALDLQIEAVLRWLRLHARWLLVLDNLDLPAEEEARRWLPPRLPGHVLVTTRTQQGTSRLGLEPLPIDVAVSFLLERTGQYDSDAARAIAEVLGGLPLALQQAAAYIEVSRRSLASYAGLLHARRAELLREGKPDDYPLPVATTWDLSFDRIEREQPAAADLLRLCAFLAPDDIPLAVLQARASELPPRLRDALQDEIGCDRALGLLGAYSLLQRQGDALRVHQLVQWVVRESMAVESQGQWLAVSVRVASSFRDRMLQQYSQLDLEALMPEGLREYLPMQLQTAFVEPNVRDNPTMELSEEKWMTPRRQPARPALEALTSTQRRRAVLLGDPGSGKSTLTRFLALSLSAADPDERIKAIRDHLPVVVELHAYAQLREQCTSVLAYIDHLARTDGLGLRAEALDAYLRRDGRALVMFDGLDEVVDPKDRDEIASLIVAFAREYPKARLLVTSRMIGYRSRPFATVGFAHYTLQDLDETQVAEFLGRWYRMAFPNRPAEADSRRGRLLGAMHESTGIRELAGNPLLLTVAALVGRQQELPRARLDVYNDAATVLVDRWDVNRHLRDERLPTVQVSREEKRELLRRIAYRMQAGTGSLANHLLSEELVDEIELYLAMRGRHDTSASRAAAAAIVRQLRERDFILSHYGADVYGFVHRVFLEFFCAEAIVRKVQYAQGPSLAHLQAEVFGRHWDDEGWHEVLRLVVAMLDSTDAAAMIAYLVTTIRQARREANPDDSSREVALAAQCLSELRDLGAVGDTATLVLGTIIEDIEESSPDHVGAPDPVHEGILAAARAIGTAWPGRDVFQNWFMSRRAEDIAWPAANLAGRLAAILGRDSEAMLALLCERGTRHARWQTRGGGLLGLAEGWPTDPGTLPLLRERAAHDIDRRVRDVVLETIARVWPMQR